jgi:outer membrane immunogenic protein
MKIHRIGLLAFTLTSVAALASANAADMYRAPEPAGPVGYKDGPYAPAWTGFYLGGNGGYGWQNNSENVSSTFIGFPNVDVTNGFDAKGGFGGGQIGYNWQGRFFGPRVVVGIEADFQGADIRDRFSQGPSAGSGLAFSDVFRSKSDLDWFGTVRGRVGYTLDHALVYATGGFAYGSLKQRITAVNSTPSVFEDVRNDDVRTGFVVGGGVEYLVAPAWSLKAEYQYIDLGSDRLTGTDPLFHSPVVTNDISNTFHTVRAGLNYHIGPTYEPLK